MFECSVSLTQINRQIGGQINRQKDRRGVWQINRQLDKGAVYGNTCLRSDHSFDGSVSLKLNTDRQINRQVLLLAQYFFKETFGAGCCNLPLHREPETLSVTIYRFRGLPLAATFLQQFVNLNEFQASWIDKIHIRYLHLRGVYSY